MYLMLDTTESVLDFRNIGIWRWSLTGGAGSLKHTVRRFLLFEYVYLIWASCTSRSLSSSLATSSRASGIRVLRHV